MIATRNARYLRTIIFIVPKIFQHTSHAEGTMISEYLQYIIVIVDNIM